MQKPTALLQLVERLLTNRDELNKMSYYKSLYYANNPPPPPSKKIQPGNVGLLNILINASNNLVSVNIFMHESFTA